MFLAWWGAFSSWVFLWTAAGLFAAVVLAPKLLVRELLVRRHSDNQFRLVLLEQQVERVREVGRALQQHPDFAASLARIDFEPHLNPDRRVIPMPRELSLDLSGIDELPDIVSVPYPWYTSLLKELTLNRTLTRGCLLLASMLTILAFLTTNGRRRQESAGGLWQRIGNRYRVGPQTDRAHHQFSPHFSSQPTGQFPSRTRGATSDSIPALEYDKRD